MRMRAIHRGDLVLINKRGRLFYARVVGAGAMDGLSVEPLDRRVSWRSATAREVTDHWGHARTERVERPADGQLRLDGVGEP